MSLQSKTGFLSHIFLIYLGTFPVIQFVSDTKGVDGRELVSKVTTDKKVTSLGDSSAYLGGDLSDNSDLPSVGIKVVSPFSRKCLEILKSYEGTNFWG